LQSSELIESLTQGKDRNRPPSYCSRLQHEVQKTIMQHQWGLENLKFQQRLKRHPQYIVTIQHIHSQHEPLVDLKTCPDLFGRSNNMGTGLFYDRPKQFEFQFYESRFQARVVRLFDIKSIFPIHTGSLSVKMKLEPLMVTMNERKPSYFTNARDGLIRDAQFMETNALDGAEAFGKEHREDGESLLDLEREIEQIFTNRIKPDVQKQLKEVVIKVVTQFFEARIKHGTLEVTK